MLREQTLGLDTAKVCAKVGSLSVTGQPCLSKRDLGNPNLELKEKGQGGRTEREGHREASWAEGPPPAHVTLSNAPVLEGGSVQRQAGQQSWEQLELGVPLQEGGQSRQQTPWRTPQLLLAEAVSRGRRSC